eukprot:14660068-Alexandrium_andersonii.AAC.1
MRLWLISPALPANGGCKELRAGPSVYKAQLCNFREHGHCKKVPPLHAVCSPGDLHRDGQPFAIAGTAIEERACRRTCERARGMKGVSRLSIASDAA